MWKLLFQHQYFFFQFTEKTYWWFYDFSLSVFKNDLFSKCTKWPKLSVLNGNSLGIHLFKYPFVFDKSNSSLHSHYSQGCFSQTFIPQRLHSFFFSILHILSFLLKFVEYLSSFSKTLLIITMWLLEHMITVNVTVSRGTKCHSYHPLESNLGL